MPSRGRRRWVEVVEVDVVEVEVEVEVELRGRMCVCVCVCVCVWGVCVGYAPGCLACALFKERLSKTRCWDAGGILLWCFALPRFASGVCLHLLCVVYSDA